LYITRYIVRPGILKNAVAIYPNVIRHCDTRMFSTTVTRKWDLYSAVCLERHPVITQSMQEIELKFYNMLKKIEFENSLKSDHELKKEREENEKKSSNTDSTDISTLIQTAQDFEDNCQEELNNFKFAPTVTSMH